MKEEESSLFLLESLGMASSATTAAYVLLDLLLRRLALPLVLVTGETLGKPRCACGCMLIWLLLAVPTGVLVRYDVFSLVYLLLFMVGLVIPGPQLKNHRGQQLTII